MSRGARAARRTHFSSHGQPAIMYRHAGMAQWQSNGFVNRGLGVRLPLPAPETFRGRCVMRSGLAAFIDLWVNALTCGCVQLVSMETPGYGVYVDKFFSPA